jgi:hypothetical protein
MRGMSCPWCGRPVRLRKDGTLPVHKSNERTLLGRARLYCLGEHRDPDLLSRTERMELRKAWRDDDGWLKAAAS